MTEKHEGSSEFGGHLNQRGTSATEVTLVLGLVLVALGFLQTGRSTWVSPGDTAGRLLRVTDLAQWWRSGEETVVLGNYGPHGPEACARGLEHAPERRFILWFAGF